MTKLSELEGVTLGIVSRREPCTAYAVRKLLKDSPSSHWRGSAGSIYPLLERLEAGRLIRSTADTLDGRGRRLLRMTARGRKALAAWIRHASTADAAAGISDQIRSRFFFLAALNAEDRRELVLATATALKAFLKTTENRLAEIDRAEDPVGWFANQNATLQARARVVWIKAVQTAIEAGELDREDKGELKNTKAGVTF